MDESPARVCVLHRSTSRGSVPMLLGLVLLAAFLIAFCQESSAGAGASLGLPIVGLGLGLIAAGAGLMEPVLVLDQASGRLGYHRHRKPLHMLPVREALARKTPNNWVELSDVQEILILEQERFEDEFTCGYAVLLRTRRGPVQVVERLWKRTARRIAATLAEECGRPVKEASAGDS